jgi:DNA-damage-inducible protein D
MEMENKILPFEGKEIRKIWHNEEWYFSIVDIITVLTDSSQPSRYWSDLKKKSEKESNQSFDFCERLKLPRPDGKSYPSDCANTEGVLRVVMSVPSPKAEPLKLWLAQVGTERIQETENPELGFERVTEIYRLKGYSEEWIKQRLTTIDIRKQLTEEWKARGVKEGQEYAILTAEIAKATFGLPPSEHAKMKGLEKQNLRDHMTNLELIFTALGEELTRDEAVRNDAQGFNENHEAAQKGGSIAGDARKRVEERTGRNVVAKDNFLHLKEEDKTEKLSENVENTERSE